MIGDKLPKRAWAVVIDGGLSLTDARLPLFWLRRVADDYRRERLQGGGRTIRVVVSAERKP